MSSRRSIRVLDLFAGAGGLTAGFHAASGRFSSIAAVELDPFAAASYGASFPDTDVYAGPIQKWVREEQAPKAIDVVIGGPPCQGFSTLGRQNADDARNSLWRHYAETIVRVRPKYFVVENVPAFAKSAQYQDFVDATRPGGSLEDYSFDFRVLNSADYGAPQARKRTILIGHHRDLPDPGFPEPTHGDGILGLIPYRTVREAFRGVPAVPDMDERFETIVTAVAGKSTHGPFSPRELHWSRDYTRLSLDRFAVIPEGGNRTDLPEELLAPCWRKHRRGAMDVMGRLHWDRPAVTIRTEFFKPEKGRYIHPAENRALTHYEAAILQGFPSTHRFIGSKTSIARQIGNAVPIPLGRAIATTLLPFL